MPRVAMAKLFVKRDLSTATLVPFRIHPELGGGSVATGVSVHFDRDSLEAGARALNHHLEDFHTIVTPIEPSELYNLMSEKERTSFFSAHIELRVKHEKGASKCTFWIGDRPPKSVGELQYPLEANQFAELLESLHTTT